MIHIRDTSRAVNVQIQIRKYFSTKMVLKLLRACFIVFHFLLQQWMHTLHVGTPRVCHLLTVVENRSNDSKRRITSLTRVETRYRVSCMFEIILNIMVQYFVNLSRHREGLLDRVTRQSTRKSRETNDRWNKFLFFSPLVHLILMYKTNHVYHCAAEI